MARSARGFTLIELMIVVVIAAILMAVAVPSFVDQLARRRLEGAVNELSADLQYARTEAISKNKQVQLVSAANGASYTINYVVAPVTPALKTVTLSNGVTVSASISVIYDALRGMVVSANDLTLSSSQTSGSLRARINAVGRIQLCSLSGTFMGYAQCV